MKRSKIFSTEEVCAIQKGTMTGFYELPKYQPIVSEDGYVYCGNFADRYKNDMMHEDWRIRFAMDYSPYELNEPIYVREKMFELGRYYTGSYDESGEYETRFISKGKFVPYNYKSQINGVDGKIISPATMPRSAARLWITPTDCKVMRVRDMTVEQSMQSLIGCNSIERMQYMHRKNKDIWDSNPFIFFYTFKITQK